MLRRRELLASIPAAAGTILLPYKAKAFGLLFPGGSASLTGTLFNVKDQVYGAKGNTIQLSDGAITNGSPNFASVSAAFVASDVGKTIAVVGAAAAGATLTTTILTFTDATHVVLNANAGATVSAALAYYGTDDTAAIQAAIDAARTAGGGIVFAPVGIYMISGALGGTQNAQLQIPLVDQTTSPATKLISIAIVGALYDNPAWAIGGGSQLPQIGGTIFYSPRAGSGTGPAVIGTGNQNGSFPGNFSGINLNVTGLLVRTTHFGQNAIVGINANAAYCFTAEGVIVESAATTGTVIANAPPGAGDGAGIRTPANSNGAKTTLYDCDVMGKNVGFDLNEHAMVHDCQAMFCQNGFNINAASHAMGATRILTQHCTNGLVAVDGASVHKIPFLIQEWAIEHTAGGAGWTDNVADLYDPTNIVYGSATYLGCKAGDGCGTANTTFVKNGGANFTATSVF